MRHLCWIVVICSGCAAQGSGTHPDPVAVDAEGLHNVFRVSDRVFSGSGPEGEVGFQSLKSLGVRTVISVDGARPDVEVARRFGLRYVHLPVGYDGISRDRAWQLAKAARDLPGPVYIHCHHGKHRGPAATAVVLLCLDHDWSVERAEAWLKEAGTDARYRGLIDLPRTLGRPSKAQLDSVSADFPETVAVSDLARLMVEIDARFDHLKLAQKAGWTAPPDHPDIDPPHEALLLAEHYLEASRMKTHPDDLQKRLNRAAEEATQLEKHLRAIKTRGRLNGEAIRRAFDLVRVSCTDCHSRFRDQSRER